MNCAVGGEPIFLKNLDELKDLEKLDVSKDGAADEKSVQKLMNEVMYQYNLECPVLKERLRGVIGDGVDAGVI